MKSDFLTIIKRILNEFGWFKEKTGVVVAVSGGPDSMALLYALDALKSNYPMSLICAHVDHCLRTESSGDAEFVRQMAHSLQISFAMSKINVADSAKSLKVSIEEAGRIERYKFLEHVRQDNKCDWIATAHHADDAIETFFLRILRGSSPAGLHGISPQLGQVIRPLIRLTRTEISDYIEANDIPYRIDQTNSLTDTDRNFVRNALFPQIDKRFPDFRKPVLRTMNMIDRENAFLEEEGYELFQSSVRIHDGRAVINLGIVRSANRALVARALKCAVYSVSGPGIRLTSQHISACVHSAFSEKSGLITLPGNLVARKEHCEMTIGQNQSIASFPKSVEIRTQSQRCELTEYGFNLELRFLIGSEARLETANANHVFFDADKLSFPLIVRSPMHGDRVKLWGAPGSKKLKSILINYKIPKSQRPRIPLLINDGRIAWIIGLRRGVIAPVEKDTPKILEIISKQSGG